MERQNIQKAVELDNKIKAKEEAIEYIKSLREVNYNGKFVVRIRAVGNNLENLPEYEVGSEMANDILTLLHTQTHLEKTELQKELDRL